MDTDYIAKIKAPKYNYVILFDPWREDKETYWVIRKSKKGESLTGQGFSNLSRALITVAREYYKEVREIKS